MTATRPVPDTASGLLLRPWRATDAAALAAAHRDDAMRRWLTDPLDDEAGARRWIDEQRTAAERGERFSFAVLEETGELAGQVVLREIRPGAPTAEVGYWTAAPARGRRVAPRALEALTGWAFTVLDGLTALELTHQESNRASCRVAERCRYALDRVLAPWPPRYPGPGHVHVRHRDG
ncbi:GNAT family N-acetyltransferase [Streptomyces chilikensis]|uniref:GNAT family N-acetyltransferase n=1 Tax=Streptomyces chilikensis TaxID=1194079 RepID=A0ABV3ET19_9ACTN